MIRHQVEMSELLRAALSDTHWRMLNDTPLPVVCFTDGQVEHGSRAHLDALMGGTIASGEVWVSVTQLQGNTPALRACVTSYNTTEDDVLALVQMLNRTRKTCGRSAKRLVICLESDSSYQS